MKNIPLVVPTHLRANRVLVTNAVKDVILCVPQSQKEEYKEYNKDVEIVVHPDEIKGLSPKRQWIYEKFGDVFMLDDDVFVVQRVYLKKGDQDRKIKLSPAEVYGLIQDTYRICKEAEIRMFCFNSIAHPKAYSGLEPIRLNGYINGGAFGILKDDNLFFPNIADFVGEDYFISGLNAYYNRYCWMDMRFAFGYKKTEGNPGGCSDYRTEEKRRQTFLLLKKYFGDAIVKKRCSQSIRRIKSMWEKQLIIPY